MKVLVDMNLSPRWVEAIQSAGIGAVHWSAIGAPGATDHEVILWASSNGHVLFTHDLATAQFWRLPGTCVPSVIQLRSEDVAPESMAERVLGALHQHGAEIEKGPSSL